MFSGSSRLDTPIGGYARLLPLVHVIMNGMAYCDLCEMDREFCEHGLAERRRNAAAAAGGLLISPRASPTSRVALIRVTIRTTGGGPSLTRHVPGNAWETGSSCGLPVGRVLV